GERRFDVHIRYEHRLRVLRLRPPRRVTVDCATIASEMPRHATKLITSSASKRRIDARSTPSDSCKQSSDAAYTSSADVARLNASVKRARDVSFLRSMRRIVRLRDGSLIALL